jgi:hypothetical protein
VVILSNAFLRAEILPAQGGKVASLTLLPGSAAEQPLNVLSTPSSLRPCRILPRNAFQGGGIELSFPISHTPSLLEQVHCQTGVEEATGRAWVLCGERELRHGMQWSVEWSLEPEGRLLLQRVRFANPTSLPRPWMSWSNAGVPSAPDTEFHYPAGSYLRHGELMEEIDWEKQGPKSQGDIDSMVGFFWRPPPESAAASSAASPAAAALTAFGIFTPSLGRGLYHASSLPGIKLWSDGCGPDRRWVSQYMVGSASQLVEMQAGPLHDQSIKALLQPGAQHEHCEAWIPARQRLSLAGAAEAARAALARLAAAPALALFSWARPHTVDRWLLLQQQSSSGLLASPSVEPPDEASLEWAPSGLEGAGAALSWAASTEAREPARSRWLLQLGAWLAATCDDCSSEQGRAERLEAALAALRAASEDGRAAALLGRLLRRCKRDAAGAAAALAAVQPCALSLHPQLLVERDLALALLPGPEPLLQRRALLASVDALQDEALLERQVALLADEGRRAEGLQLLLSHQFSLVHQRYVRTRLWRRLAGQEAEGQRAPSSLGEDCLFGWGAYMEHSGE